jgi:CMP-N-acetylneuraminic acid synthetase
VSIIVVIPVRGGSKRVPQKNIRKFQGMPLLAWSIRAAQHCKLVDEIYVSTDDQQIADIATQYGAKVLWRPEVLASDVANTFDVLKYVYYEQLSCSPELLVLLQATSPLREENLIFKGIKSFLSDDSTDRLMEVNGVKLFSGKVLDGIWKGDYPEETRSQDLPTTYIPSGRLYIYRCISTLEKNLPEGHKTRVIVGDYETNINIDYESDFDKLNFVYSRYEKRYNYLLTSGEEYGM